MKKLFVIAAVLVLSAAHAQAARSGEDAKHVAARKALPQPAPYGAYFLDQLGQERADYYASLDAIAKHYRYKDASDARRACIRARTAPNCSSDIVAHRRHESAEIAKFGFKNWEAARDACNKTRGSEFGKLSHCSADPFLRLRSKK